MFAVAAADLQYPQLLLRSLRYRKLSPVSRHLDPGGQGVQGLPVQCPASLPHVGELDRGAAGQGGAGCGERRRTSDMPRRNAETLTYRFRITERTGHGRDRPMPAADLAVGYFQGECKGTFHPGSGDTALFPQHDAQGSVITFQCGNIEAFPGSRFDADQGHCSERCCSRTDHAPAFVVRFLKAPDEQETETKLSGNGSDERFSPVVPGPAHDERPGFACS